VETLMAGGEAEFVAFASAALPRLRRTARLLCGESALAEDLTQTVLLKVYMSWHRSATWRSPHAYAQRVLYATFCSWAGRRWNGELATAELPERAGVDPFESSDTGRVHAALLQLPRRQRAVLIARYYDDLSVEQAARLLACSESTVRAQATRGLQRLRDALAPAHSLAEGS
jgi:RNA polymerase sigma-70 factor (sigma-E family)